MILIKIKLKKKKPHQIDIQIKIIQINRKRQKKYLNKLKYLKLQQDSEWMEENLSLKKVSEFKTRILNPMDD